LFIIVVIATLENLRLSSKYIFFRLYGYQLLSALVKKPVANIDAQQFQVLNYTTQHNTMNIDR
jgi:hypothetical protein